MWPRKGSSQPPPRPRLVRPGAPSSSAAQGFLGRAAAEVFLFFWRRPLVVVTIPKDGDAPLCFGTCTRIHRPGAQGRHRAPRSVNAGAGAGYGIGASSPLLASGEGGVRIDGVSLYHSVIGAVPGLSRNSVPALPHVLFSVSK